MCALLTPSHGLRRLRIFFHSDVWKFLDVWESQVAWMTGKAERGGGSWMSFALGIHPVPVTRLSFCKVIFW